MFQKKKRKNESEPNLMHLVTVPDQAWSQAKSKARKRRKTKSTGNTKRKIKIKTKREKIRKKGINIYKCMKINCYLFMISKREEKEEKIYCTVKAEEIPEIPKNSFLLRRSPPIPYDDRHSSQRSYRDRIFRDRRIKGRGFRVSDLIIF